MTQPSDLYTQPRYSVHTTNISPHVVYKPQPPLAPALPQPIQICQPVNPSYPLQSPIVHTVLRMLYSIHTTVYSPSCAIDIPHNAKPQIPERRPTDEQTRSSAEAAFGILQVSCISLSKSMTHKCVWDFVRCTPYFGGVGCLGPAIGDR